MPSITNGRHDWGWGPNTLYSPLMDTPTALLLWAVVSLPAKDRKQETTDLCKEIDGIESQADRIQRKAITNLFDGSTSIWTAIKMREFYALQEEVLDRCEDAAKTIEEILIENS